MNDWGPMIVIGLVGYMLGMLLHLFYDLSRGWSELGWPVYRITLWILFIPQELFCMGRWLWRIWIAEWKDALGK